MMIKIEIKSIFGDVKFAYECENNTIAKTLEEAVAQGADLRFANLRSAKLYGVNLSGSDLTNADLRFADLRGANLRNANLYGADLSGADLSVADLSNANLIHANLSNAKLSGADLSHAFLNGANLSGAKLDKRYIQVGCIGSAKRMTTYCFDDDIIWCGCFKGTLEEFETQVQKTHQNNEQFLKEYNGVINYIKSLK